MTLRIGMVINPTSGKNTGGRIGTEAATLLRARGHEIVDLSGMDADSARGRAREALAQGRIDRLVVSGGDGMVHLGLNLCAQTDVPLGIIAAGTGNDIARELGLPVRNAIEAVERIERGTARRVDLLDDLVRGRPRGRLRRRRQRAGQRLALAQGPDALHPGHPA